MEDILQKAAANQRVAREIIENTGVERIWKSIGAEPNLVGSLRMGLLMTHRDVDLHIYSDHLDPAESFAAMALLAADPRIRRIEYTNLIETEERCLEWHAWYEHTDGNTWQLDMIHIERGSRYDGYFENVADRIVSVLTPEITLAILTLKNDTPETEKIAGIEYYQAVIRDGIRGYADFARWRKEHPLTGIAHWVP